jgi:uncharacterized paraquat-inducible protein A
MRRIARVLPVLVLVLGLAGGGEVAACPNCKEAVAAQPSEVASMKDGYNWSVLFMLAMPFTLLGTGLFMVARAVKRGALPEM